MKIQRPGQQPVLDLNNPPQVWAKSENEETTTFHLLVPEGRYTKASLTKDPTIDPKHQLMRPWTISHGDVDGEGRAMLDLVASGRAKEIADKLEERLDMGKPPITEGLGVFIVTAREGNKVPPKQLAEVHRMRIIGTPQIQLNGVVDFVTVQNFKSGKKKFLVDMTTVGPLGAVEIRTTPASQIKVGGQQGNGKVMQPVQDGQKLRIEIPVPFTKREETRTKRVPPPYKHFQPGGWRTRGARATFDPKIGAWVINDEDLHLVRQDQLTHTRTDKREIWTGGNITLRVEGTQHEVTSTIKLRAESWSSNWLKGPPPPPFRHNIC